MTWTDKDELHRIRCHVSKACHYLSEGQRDLVVSELTAALSMGSQEFHETCAEIGIDLSGSASGHK